MANGIMEIVNGTDINKCMPEGFAEFVADVLREIYKVKKRKEFTQGEYSDILIKWQKEGSYPVSENLKRFFPDKELKAGALLVLLYTASPKLVNRSDEKFQLSSTVIAALKNESIEGVALKGKKKIELKKHPRVVAPIVKYLMAFHGGKFTIEQFNAKIAFLKQCRDGKVTKCAEVQSCFGSGKEVIKKCVLRYEKIFGNIDNLFEKLLKEGYIISARKTKKYDRDGKDYYKFNLEKCLVFKK